jgi:ABC-type lipopolysaccharide export system ATPase subunit
MATERPLLVVEGIDTFYGDAQALNGLSLTIGSGETVCLLGRNGQGKTTTIKSILGLVPPRRGRITRRRTSHACQPRIANRGSPGPTTGDLSDADGGTEPGNGLHRALPPWRRGGR